MNSRWKCRLRQNFFGLSDKYIEGVYEEIYQLKHHENIDIVESYNLPVTIRRWFQARSVEQLEKEKNPKQK